VFAAAFKNSTKIAKIKEFYEVTSATIKVMSRKMTILNKKCPQF
jgi:hypothetical protein